MKRWIPRPSTLVFTLAAAAIFACKKEETPGSIPVEFKTTEYNVLTPYDSTTGRPLNLLKDTIPSDMLAYIKLMLPERQDLRVTNPQLLEYSPTAPDLAITKSS